VGSEAEVLEWDDVKAAVEPMIAIWVEGSESAWAKHAWELLGAAGLTSYSTEIERTRCLLRAVGVGRLYREFSARAFDEASPGDWRDHVGGDLIGGYPLLDAFTLGQLAEREGLEADNTSFADYSVVDEVLCDLVDLEYPQVVGTLYKALGDADLFASLYLSRQEDVTYPLSDDQVGKVVNFDVTGDKMHAWQWFTENSPRPA